MRLHRFVPLGNTGDHVCANCARVSGLPPSALRALPAVLARCEDTRSPKVGLWQRIFGPHNTFNCYVGNAKAVGVSSGTARVIRRCRLT